MAKLGYLDNVCNLTKKERTIKIPKLPPFVFQTHYKPNGSKV